MMMALCFILFGLLFVLPFVPGIREIRKKEDAEPLFIDMEYRKDPCYFSRSLKNKLTESINSDGKLDGILSLNLSKEEMVEIIENASTLEQSSIKNVCYFKGDFNSGSNVSFEKEVYVRGNACIGESNQLYALACDGDVSVLKGTRFLRWIDSEGSINVGEQCDLGVSATCTGSLSIASNCSFKRLYGFPVVTRGDSVLSSEEKYCSNKGEIPVFEVRCNDRNPLNIPPNSCEDYTYITSRSLTIGDNALVRGHVKALGDIVTGECVTIAGNLFAEGDIHIGAHSSIRGTVFSQGRIILDQGVTIGSKGKVKSVIGKQGIILGYGVQVFGYVMTEGEGCIT